MGYLRKSVGYVYCLFCFSFRLFYSIRFTFSGLILYQIKLWESSRRSHKYQGFSIESQEEIGAVAPASLRRFFAQELATLGSLANKRVGWAVGGGATNCPSHQKREVRLRADGCEGSQYERITSVSFAVFPLHLPRSCCARRAWDDVRHSARV